MYLRLRSKLIHSAALAAGLLLSLVNVNAQATKEGGIEGRVLNASTGDYLNNARVTVVGTRQEVLTDSGGWYRLSDLPDGPVTLKLTHPSAVERTVVVNVVRGEVMTHDIKMLSSSSSVGAEADKALVLDTFTVAAQREFDASAIAINEQRVSASIKNVVSADEFGDVTEGNIGDFAKFIPGITVDYVASDARTISVRGVPPAFTQVTMGGAPVASANSSASGRQFELEQVSLNNTARIEIYKSRTPDIAASALGGSVNLVPRSAFERSEPSFSYRAFLSLNGDAENSFKKTRGPASSNTYKVRPGIDFSYVRPVNRNFGFTVSVLDSNVFNEQDMTGQVWAPHMINQSATATVGATVANPVLTQYVNRLGPKTTHRQSIGSTMDWRVTPEDVLSVGAQWNRYDAFFANRQNNINLSNGNFAPLSFDSTHTTGANGVGSVQMASGLTNKYGTTYGGDVKWKHLGPIWRINGGLSFSHASNHYADTEFGRFSGVVLRLRGLPDSTTYGNYSPTLRYENIGSEGIPGNVVVLDATGTKPIDVSNPANYNITSVSVTPRLSSDSFKTAFLNLQRDVGVSFPFTVKVGGQIQQQRRDIRQNNPGGLAFVGPDGVANTADDNYALYDLVDPAFATSFPWQKELVFPYMNNHKVYDLYLKNPGYFSTNPATLIINTANASKWFEETIAAAFAMGDMRLFDGRLRLVGGVRFERTEDKGLGGLNDPARIPPGVTDPVARAKAQYTERGFKQQTSYDDYYPSLDASFNLSEKLLIRLAHAKSIGRPDLNFILPGITVPDPLGTGRTITVTNSNLKPTVSNGYDLSLEYYFKKTGLVSVGAFQKDFTDFHGGVTRTATTELLELYEVPNPELYADGTYVISTRLNTGDARVQGLEFNYRQVLDFEFLPQWARAFTVFANGQILDLKGSSQADFNNFVEKTFSWGVKYSVRRFTAQVNVNHRGQQKLNPMTLSVADVYQYRPERLLVDANFEYRWRPAVSFFVNVRNLRNDPLDLLQFAPDTPDYAKLRQREVFGSSWTIGVKGTF